MGQLDDRPSVHLDTVLSLSRPDSAYDWEIDDDLDGSWKPRYNEHERMDRKSLFSKHIEAFVES